MQNMLKLAMALSTAALAFGQGSKMASDLKRSQSGSLVDVIVQYQRLPTAAHHHKIVARGGLLQKTLDSIRAAHYTIPFAAVEELTKDPEVLFVSPNRRLTPSLDVAAAAVNGTVAAQYGYDGAGIGIAVIDSGIGSNGDLAGSAVSS